MHKFGLQSSERSRHIDELFILKTKLRSGRWKLLSLQVYNYLYEATLYSYTTLQY